MYSHAYLGTAMPTALSSVGCVLNLVTHTACVHVRMWRYLQPGIRIDDCVMAHTECVWLIPLITTARV
jgi:hypothetical protein